MASRFAFSVGDKPSFNSCGAYIYNLISKVNYCIINTVLTMYYDVPFQGEINETTIRPSAPLAEKLIHVITTRRKYLQEVWNNKYCHCRYTHLHDHLCMGMFFVPVDI